MHYPMQRTPTGKLPKQDAALITTVENQLDQCHATLLADATSLLCSSEQRVALQDALVNLVRARLHWSTEAYQQEMDFYIAENTRRQAALSK